MTRSTLIIILMLATFVNDVKGNNENPDYYKYPSAGADLQSVAK